MKSKDSSSKDVMEVKKVEPANTKKVVMLRDAAGKGGTLLKKDKAYELPIDSANHQLKRGAARPLDEEGGEEESKEEQQPAVKTPLNSDYPSVTTPLT